MVLIMTSLINKTSLNKHSDTYQIIYKWWIIFFRRSMVCTRHTQLLNRVPGTQYRIKSLNVIRAKNICAHSIKDCRTPSYGQQKEAVWCNNISGSDRKFIWQVRLIPTNETNVEETKQSNTSDLLCRSIVNPPQHTTIIAKEDSGALNNYWRTEDMTVLTNVKKNREKTTVQLPNNETISTTRTGNIPLASSLSSPAKRAHIFDVLHSASLISLVQLFDDDCVAILY